MRSHNYDKVSDTLMLYSCS